LPVCKFMKTIAGNFYLLFIRKWNQTIIHFIATFFGLSTSAQKSTVAPAIRL
jgi:hypothetical protein